MQVLQAVLRIAVFPMACLINMSSRNTCFVHLCLSVFKCLGGAFKYMKLELVKPNICIRVYRNYFLKHLLDLSDSVGAQSPLTPRQLHSQVSIYVSFYTYLERDAMQHGYLHIHVHICCIYTCMVYHAYVGPFCRMRQPILANDWRKVHGKSTESHQVKKNVVRKYFH